MKYLQGIFFSMLILLLLLPSTCSAQPALQKKANIDGLLKDLPTTMMFAIGDTVTIQAINSPPYIFDKWSGDLTSYGSQNPITVVITAPMTVIIDYTTVPLFGVSISFVKFLDKKNLEFTLILSADSGMTLTSYQGSIRVGSNIIPSSSTLTFSYVEGSSQNELKPNLAVNVYNEGATELGFGTNPGNVVYPVGLASAVLGSFILTCSKDFISYNPILTWNFDGNVKTIFTGKNFADITDPLYFVADLSKIFVNVKFQ